jgi:hypothetical protein
LKREMAGRSIVTTDVIMVEFLQGFRHEHDCMRRVHTPPRRGVKKSMYPETNTLPKQPYPVRSARRGWLIISPQKK